MSATARKQNCERLTNGPFVGVRRFGEEQQHVVVTVPYFRMIYYVLQNPNKNMS
jgi:hypothetical protein